MAATVDLDAYFQRVRWSGGRDPTLETLAGLVEAHTAHIPFENLDVLLGALLHGSVIWRRGVEGIGGWARS
jgi:arylamine N-acetyltransferase